MSDNPITIITNMSDVPWMIMDDLSGADSEWPKSGPGKPYDFDTDTNKGRYDEELVKAIPSHLRFKKTELTGQSAWVQTARMEAEDLYGGKKVYFKKSARGRAAYLAMFMSLQSEQRVHEYLPENVPEPIKAWYYASDRDLWFYLSSFHASTNEPLKLEVFVSLVVKLHRGSMGHAPDGHPGGVLNIFVAGTRFDSNSYRGEAWEPPPEPAYHNWEGFFSSLLTSTFIVEAKKHGKFENDDSSLQDALIHKVVPRLLGPLCASPKFKLCLLHGNLWTGNALTEKETSKIMLINSGSFYGHNESDLGLWKLEKLNMGAPFIDEYKKQMGVSEPVEDFEGRLALYALRYELLVSSSAKTAYRREAIKKQIQDLIGKYGKDDTG